MKPQGRQLKGPFPLVQLPAPMDADELRTILFALASAYGDEFGSYPLRELAPALGLKSPRMLQRWLAGQGEVPPLVAKTLRMFHTHSKVW